MKIERHLSKDPALDEMLCAFRFRCWGSTEDDAPEDLSAWHPVLWRAVPLALIVSTTLALAMFYLWVAGVL